MSDPIISKKHLQDAYKAARKSLDHIAACEHVAGNHSTSIEAVEIAIGWREAQGAAEEGA